MGRFLLGFPRYCRLFFRLLKDSRVGILPKIVFVGAVLYFILPLDLFPDLVIPILGWTDDLVIFYVAGRFLLRHAPPELIEHYLQNGNSAPPK
jgi:uncharacterized membrane protein YkvA (DUF1232 family)